MVSCSISFPNKTSRQVLLPMDPPDALPADQEEFDFSDVFGPSLSHASIDVDVSTSENSVPQSAADGKFCVAPLVIHNRSHSLVGPSPRITQFSQFTKLTLHETESSLEIVECSLDENAAHQEKSINDPEKNDNATEEVSSMRLEDFEVLKVVGQGAFGKVFQVKRKGTSEIFAMKVMRKDKIMEKNHADYMKAERDILTKVDHPFVVQLRYSFQTKYRLYLVLDFVNGGHLFFQLYHHGLFREDLARIYAAEIVSAVSHLHANGIMHRDLKPENILLDADGHVMLTDFGLAKEFDENTRSNSMCGTVEYMAPEIILGKGHDKAADWWSVGILLFEMLTGKPPFVGGNRNKIQQKIVKDKIKLPSYLSSEAHSILKGLLQKEANKRLGGGADGSNEIKKHVWFKSINWKKLDAREIQPSFRPNVSDKSSIANFDEKWTSMSVLDSPIASPVAGDYNFTGFTYVRPPVFLQKPSPLQHRASSPFK
ncbi:serine/threonine-protein kinase AtPK2/AtPK19 isoform X1 [Dendrobium catenatum]|uniref:serine/threonine-protein kinase AtPK2/AtPK19 isoform X1 n=1 Tax=Dendrobium catenatum TaxID=906689 RepID=UPI0009F34A6F|nr:serine/threonine-protein kinase AtPK2/AtPK19 isoform X1 [Dendrobium catenatum]